MINLVFDHLSREVIDSISKKMIFDPQQAGNLINYNDVEHPKFSFSPAIRRFIFNNTSETINITRDFSTSHYLYSIGVGHDPRQWCGGGFAGKFVPSVFDLLPERLVKDLKNKKALLLLDQSYEGYHEDFLWDWFHCQCYSHEIPIDSVVYITGDLDAEDSYTRYCKLNRITKQLKVVGEILCDYILRDPIKLLDKDFDSYYNYKFQNQELIKLFDCLNSNPRTHRLINFVNLKKHGLVDQGLVSFRSADFYNIDNAYRPNNFDKIVDKINKILPLDCFAIDQEQDLSKMINRVRSDVYKNSWISLVTEASYFANTGKFISEKIFKPMSCFQPFLLLGPRHSLLSLQQRGFQTFHPWIDETYDKANDQDRFQKIIESLKKFQRIPNKVEWYKNIQNIVEFNFNRLQEEINKHKAEPIINYYKEYFHVS